MNAERAQAYGRVVRVVDDLGPVKLSEIEQRQIRDAADTLLFCGEPGCVPEAQAALADVEQLLGELVDAGRWTPERADRLLADLEHCGPLSLSLSAS